jgi:hypothetical protein
MAQISLHGWIYGDSVKGCTNLPSKTDDLLAKNTKAKQNQCLSKSDTEENHPELYFLALLIV